MFNNHVQKINVVFIGNKYLFRGKASLCCLEHIHFENPYLNTYSLCFLKTYTYHIYKCSCFAFSVGNRCCVWKTPSPKKNMIDKLRFAVRNKAAMISIIEHICVFHVASQLKSNRSGRKYLSNNKNTYIQQKTYMFSISRISLSRSILSADICVLCRELAQVKSCWAQILCSPKITNLFPTDTTYFPSKPNLLFFVIFKIHELGIHVYQHET